jgi:hypothetical protein
MRRASQVTENKELTEACLAAHSLYLAPKALQPGVLCSTPVHSKLPWKG